MGLEDLMKEGEQALDGQDSSNQQVQSEQSGGNESRNDTMLDSGKFLLITQSTCHVTNEANKCCL